ncbi:E3 ubiquitin-protein ligase IPI1-like [Tasmannia lanceolata]|uniref:E3 ubiquitin-protein ligase IPI1-like n=1 Tax=Tasmannia lanceolata TaxID=3420 RepID=UPI004063583F
MDFEKSNFSVEDRKGDLFCGRSPVYCSICLDCVVDRGERSIAKLQCGHEFHLDCIGSAFNAKGAMQCPNCRKVEKGQWLFANECRSFTEFNVDELVNEEYDLSYPELPFGLQWCPFRGGFLSSLFEEGEVHSNAYHDLLGSAAFGDLSNASISTHVCPYLMLHGFSHAIHPTPSNATDTIPDTASFNRHPTGLGGPSAGDVMNSHSFSVTDPRHHNWQQASHPFPVSGSTLNNTEQPASQLASRLSRSDPSGQQRVGSFVHPLPFVHGSVARAGSNLVTSVVPPIMGDARGHGHGARIYQQSASSSSIRNTPFAPIRRTRPRGLTLISSAGTNSSIENSGFYGFSVSGSVNRNQQDGESIGRHFDQFYGWAREGFAPMPWWIPIEGESQWWSPPVHPNQNPQPGSADSMNRSYFTQRVIPDRVGQGRPDNTYQRLPNPRMSPFM